MKTIRIKRGDIVLINIPESDNHTIYGLRPHIVVSNNTANKNSQIITVVPLTSKPKKQLPTHITIEGFGLTKPSTVLTEQLYSVDKSLINKRIGHISDAAIMKKITKCLGIQLDVA